MAAYFPLVSSGLHGTRAIFSKVSFQSNTLVRTSQPSVHWIVPILAGVPFGVAIAQILQSLTAYLMDTYTIYAASAIAATVVLRSIFAMAFPLFSPVMFEKLGDQWACTVFAFLALACTPMPMLFWVSMAYLKWIFPGADSFSEIRPLDTEQVKVWVQRVRSSGFAQCVFFSPGDGCWTRQWKGPRKTIGGCLTLFLVHIDTPTAINCYQHVCIME